MSGQTESYPDFDGSEESENKLINRLTVILEEYGMPKFRDRCPALDIIQLFRDSGWNETK